MAAMRKKMSRKSNKRLFNKGVKTAHANVQARPMRGGIRL